LDAANTIHQRANTALELLDENAGFSWERKPLGAMFLFPDVCSLYDRIPVSYKTNHHFVGDAVAQYLIKERRVAVVPGSVYGTEGNNHIRMVLCTPEKEFNLGLERLRHG
jgi:aspartate/methionine/tyrosine aminotransferase